MIFRLADLDSYVLRKAQSRCIVTFSASLPARTSIGGLGCSPRAKKLRSAVMFARAPTTEPLRGDVHWTTNGAASGLLVLRGDGSAEV